MYKTLTKTKYARPPARPHNKVLFFCDRFIGGQKIIITTVKESTQTKGTPR